MNIDKKGSRYMMNVMMKQFQTLFKINDVLVYDSDLKLLKTTV